MPRTHSRTAARSAPERDAMPHWPHGSSCHRQQQCRDGDSGQRLGSVENLVAEEGHRVHDLAGFNEAPAQLGPHLRACATSTLRENTVYTKNTSETARRRGGVLNGSGCGRPDSGPPALGPIAGGSGSRTPGPPARRPTAPGPSVSRETFGGPRATPPRGPSAHAPSPIRTLDSRAAHSRRCAPYRHQRPNSGPQFHL